jgi:hypothetical protein
MNKLKIIFLYVKYIKKSHETVKQMNKFVCCGKLIRKFEKIKKQQKMQKKSSIFSSS